MLLLWSLKGIVRGKLDQSRRCFEVGKCERSGVASSPHAERRENKAMPRLLTRRASFSPRGEMRRERRRERRYLVSPCREKGEQGDASSPRSAGFLLPTRGDEARKEKGTTSPHLPIQGEGRTRRCLVFSHGEKGE
ncbi:hypothetical protein B296_00030430 [Ensete ventricosum]|uniref:Uncharacterized protein n=1 Tax=Ensete ventricosum TaxID=4639 RepID=A0A426YLG6_ENSVE|nr:hypothetical protein B296_00030430 [Ensete ventricosum]